MEFSDIASVSGKGGLYKVINPTRTGVILEAMDDSKKKLIAGMHTKVSVLSDISIFTTDGDGAVPLQEVMQKIHSEFKGDTGLDKKADPDELKAFLKHILPNYDEERVYISDIKKLVSWYNLLAKEVPEVLEPKKEKKEKKSEDSKKEDKPKTKAKPAAKKSTGSKPAASKSAKTSSSKAASKKSGQSKKG